MVPDSIEKTSDFHPEPGPVPRHVGIIPDGGRRWAMAQGLTLEEAYVQTRASLQVFVGFLLEHGVKEISIYLSSIQNFRREADELVTNLDMVESSLTDEIGEIAQQRKLRVAIVGNRDIIPESLLAAVISIEQSTLYETGGRLNLLLAYDPLEEIIQAMKASENPARFFSNLRVTSPVDLIIRSGGAALLSNFLPIQSGFARLFFSDKLFNDLTIGDLDGILKDFAKTDRKFGE